KTSWDGKQIFGRRIHGDFRRGRLRLQSCRRCSCRRPGNSVSGKTTEQRSRDKESRTDPNRNWNSFGAGDRGQHWLAPKTGVHCHWEHREYRFAHAGTDQDDRKTAVGDCGSARSFRRFVHLRGTAATGSPRDRRAIVDLRCAIRNLIMTSLSEVINYTNDFLRIREIGDWGNALNGLQIENSGGITKIGAAVDASTRILKAAAKQNVDL